MLVFVDGKGPPADAADPLFIVNARVIPKGSLVRVTAETAPHFRGCKLFAAILALVCTADIHACSGFLVMLFMPLSARFAFMPDSGRASGQGKRHLDFFRVIVGIEL